MPSGLVLQLYPGPDTGCLRSHTERKRKHFQEGVLYLPDKGLEVFFVTLNKSDKDYSPSTMYRDYAINEKIFHWQSQSIISVESTTGQRYTNQQLNSNQVLIFVKRTDMVHYPIHVLVQLII